MDYLRIKNWSKHQHYKDRRPPWIKLHMALLSDYEFVCLQDASKLLLICLWMLAADSGELHEDGDPMLPADEKYLARKLPIDSKIDLKPLFDSGFIVRYQVASKTLDERKQLVPSETETETENRDRTSSPYNPPSSKSESFSYFADRWKIEYGRPYVRTGPKDKKIKPVVEQIGIDSWRSAVDAYFGDRDPFVVKAIHSLEVMLSRINLYLTPKDDPFAETKSRFADLRPDEN
jgi:hypothetical protein